MFIPIGDDNSRRLRTPFIVYLLIAANIAVWFLQLTGGEQFTYAFATVPFEISHGRDVVGLKYIAAGYNRIPIPHSAGPEPIYLTLFTAMFMHGSWMHLIGNMLYLGIFGDQIEDLLGHWKFILFYLICGVTAGLAQVWYSPNSLIPCLGASGAIAGVLGAYLIKYPTNRVHVLFWNTVVQFPAIIVLGLWVFLQIAGQTQALAAEQAGGVAYMAHIGGFVAGFVMIMFASRSR